MTRYRISLLLAAAAVLSACAHDGASDAAGAASAPVQAAAPGQTEIEARTLRETKLNQGRIIVYTECASCHAPGPAGPSPREDAPPLRNVLARYNAASLELDLMEGMRVGHADMPRFTFDPRTVDALLIYLESIQAWGRADTEGTARSTAGF